MSKNDDDSLDKITCIHDIPLSEYCDACAEEEWEEDVEDEDEDEEWNEEQDEDEWLDVDEDDDLTFK